MKWDAVFFDLDDTLYSRAETFQRVARRFVEVHIGHDSDEPLEATVEKLVRWDESESREGTSQEARQSLMNRIKSEYPSITSSADELIAWYRDEMIEQLSPDPALEPVLDRLAGSRVPWGVITNGDRFQLRKISSLGLAGRPEQIILSDVEGWRKPDIRLFNLALERMGIEDSDRVLMVGDNPVADIRGASGAGIETAWLSLGQTWNLVTHQPDIQLDSLSDLLEHLD